MNELKVKCADTNSICRMQFVHDYSVVICSVNTFLSLLSRLVCLLLSFLLSILLLYCVICILRSALGE